MAKLHRAAAGKESFVFGSPAQTAEVQSLGALAASFFDASEDCVKVLSVDGSLLAMNLNGICLLEIDDFEQFRGRSWTDMWPEQARATVANAVCSASEGKGATFIADCPTAKATLKTWDVSVWPVLGNDGKPVQLISISRDITAQRQADEERALFARELAHRIKNMFAVVDGVISLSARLSVDAKPFATALRNRIYDLGQAIAYVSPPELIGIAPSKNRTVCGLLRTLLKPYGDIEGPAQRIAISGDDAPLGATATTSLALIINELATNAMKYGALLSDQGRTSVTLTTDDSTLCIEWVEDVVLDAAMPGGHDKSGFGSELLKNAVERQMGGQYRRDWTDRGVSIEMRFPLQRVSR
jgi:two-component sensor histidine kinase